MSIETFTDVELELGALLQEFQVVAEELREPSQGTPHAYERLLSDAKRRMGHGNNGVNDSGVDDSDYSSEASLGNSLNTSEEELQTAGVTMPTKAKLGDTGDLESFIACLDRELAEMWAKEREENESEGYTMWRRGDQRLRGLLLQTEGWPQKPI